MSGRNTTNMLQIANLNESLLDFVRDGLIDYDRQRTVRNIDAIAGGAARALIQSLAFGMQGNDVVSKQKGYRD